MILGVGTDLVEISRVRQAAEKESFRKLCFTPAELEAAARPEMLADDFAVKEAVAKALGTGVRGFSLRDIEVLRDPLGKPFVRLYGAVKERCAGTSIHVSISNTDTLSMAFAVIEKPEEVPAAPGSAGDPASVDGLSGQC